MGATEQPPQQALVDFAGLKHPAKQYYGEEKGQGESYNDGE